MTDAALSPALQGLLRDLPSSFPPERIDAVWVFPPRQLRDKESGVVVLSLLPEEPDPEQSRRVVTARYEAERTRTGVRRTDSVAEQGRAPAERIPRLIAGVVARLGETGEEPLTGTVAGDPARWDELMERLGVLRLDLPHGE